MAGISGNSIAEAMKKSYQNLINSEQAASSFTAFVDQQTSNQTAEIGPIRVKLNDPDNNVGDVLHDGTSVTPSDTVVARQLEREKNNDEIAVINKKIAAKEAEIEQIKTRTESMKSLIRDDTLRFDDTGNFEDVINYKNLVNEDKTILANRVPVSAEESQAHVKSVKSMIDAERGAIVPIPQNHSVDTKGLERDAIGRIVESSTGFKNDIHGGSAIDPEITSTADRIAADSTINGNAKTALAEQLASQAALKKIEKDAKAKSAAARQLEIFNNSVQKLAESDTNALGELKEVEISNGPHPGTDGFAYKSKLASEDESLTFVEKGLGIIKDEQTLDEVIKERKEKERIAQQKVDAKFKRDETLLNPDRRDKLGRDAEEIARTKLENDAQDQFTEVNAFVNEKGVEVQKDVADGRITVDELKDAKRDRLKALGAANNDGAGKDETKNTKKSVIKEKRPPFQTNASLSGIDPFRFSTLAYPLDVTTDMTNGHYILFYVNVQNKTKYEYQGYDDDGYKATIGDVVETSSIYFDDQGINQQVEAGLISLDDAKRKNKYKTQYYTNTGADAGDIAYQRQQHVSKGKKGNILQSNQVILQRQRKATTGLASQLDLTSRITDSVALYLPANVQNDTSTSYQGFKTGMAGYLALSGGSVIDKIRNHDFDTAADQFMGMGGTIIYDMIRKAGIGAFGAATGGEGVQQNFDKAFGQTMNPFIEVAFDSMGVRSFEYTFDFRPRNVDETDEVDAIIKLFRFHMVPELKGTNHRYMTIPSTFDIHYMYQTSRHDARENDFYNKIATCVLEDCRVNYTPGEDVMSFESGAPTHITMTLKFMETEMLTKEKVNQGF